MGGGGAVFEGLNVATLVATNKHFELLGLPVLLYTPCGGLTLCTGRKLHPGISDRLP